MPVSPVRRRRNMRPCLTCSMQKSRCKLVSPGLCENCQKNGRTQCVDHVPWRNIKAAQSSIRQSFARGQSSRRPSTNEATTAILQQGYNNHNHVGILGQQCQAPNNTSPHSPHHFLGIPLFCDPAFVNASSQQGIYPQMISPDGRFNNPMFASSYMLQPDAPMVPPYMQNLGSPSSLQDVFTTVNFQESRAGSELPGINESYAIQDSSGSVEITRKHDGIFSAGWPLP